MTQLIIMNDTDEQATWQKELANAVKNPQELFKLLELAPKIDNFSALARKDFPLLAPLPFVAKMEKGNLSDPLLMQILPVKDEELIKEGFTIDPLGEQNNKIQGLLHKYKSRVLLILKSGCAINCRYCFRRHFPYRDNSINKNQFNEIVSYIEKNPEINEVILSGGDPLMNSDQRISDLLDRLEKLPQLKRMRIHSRLPVVIPSRITDKLCERLSHSPLKIIFVLHINHPNEIDEVFTKAMDKLHYSGIQLLNQSVLLKGVNDTSSILVELSEALSQANILPYYLFLLDKVQGAAHFDLEEKQAKQLIREMLIELPGYLVPKLSREIAGEKSKTIISC